MFDFFKKKTARNFAVIDNRVKVDPAITTKNMSNEEYMRAVEGGILPHWSDAELMRKIGVDDLFAEDVKAKNALSYEEACDCLKRVSRMMDMSAYVVSEFTNRSEDLLFGDDDGTVNARKRHFSASNVRDMFIEAQTKATISDVELENNVEGVMEDLNNLLAMLPKVKDLTFDTIALGARVAFTEMIGYID